MDSEYDQNTTTAIHLFMPSATSARVPHVATSPQAAVQQARDTSGEASLNQRLDAVLQGLVAGLECDAADFYTLDAPSKQLLLRSHHQAGDGEPGPARRPLGEARADVAAMAGNAIVLENDVEVANWVVPVWCGAAICLPVSSDETIHGTLWLYSREPRPFTDAQLGLMEIVAGRLAVELELAALRLADREPKKPAPPQQPSTAEAANAPALQSTSTKLPARAMKPSATPMLDEWELAGLVDHAQQHRAFYDWQTLADGRTLVTAGTLVDGIQAIDLGWLQAARVALRAHVHDSHDAGDLLTRANQTLWTASPGGEGLALGAMLLDSDGVHASVALAGAAAALRWRASSYDWTAATCPPLGWNEQTVYVAQRTELKVRERLVLLVSGQPLDSKGPTNKFASHLRKPTSAELRSMPGKRALRHLSEATDAMRMTPASSVLVRRR